MGSGGVVRVGRAWLARVRVGASWRGAFRGGLLFGERDQVGEAFLTAQGRIGTRLLKFALLWL